MTYPTFETRLVPISEAPITQKTGYTKDGEYFQMRECPYLLGYDEKNGIYNLSYLGWCRDKEDNVLWSHHNEEDRWEDCGEGFKLEPTHFLQFKINGEWTHEFKMEEE